MTIDERAVRSSKHAAGDQMRFWLIGLCLVTGVGCATVEYAVEILNDTGVMIDDAHVTFEGFQSVGGSMPNGISKMHMGISREIPEAVQVQWRLNPGGVMGDPGRPLQQVTVHIPPALRDHLTARDVLVFAIHRDGTVTVTREQIPA